MPRKSQKKGPQQMTKPKSSNDDLARQSFDAELDSFAAKVHRAIEDARAKMTDAELEKADREADAILNASNAKTKPSRHTA
jgi:flagellar hook-basal body complex protein FliE